MTDNGFACNRIGVGHRFGSNFCPPCAPPKKWVIHKASRSYSGGLGYTGPSWEAAGLSVPTGPLSRRDAEQAVKALDKVNAVGWVITEYVDD